MNVADLKRKFAAGLRARGSSPLVELFRRQMNSCLIKTAMNRAVQKYAAGSFKESDHARDDAGKFVPHEMTKSEYDQHVAKIKQRPNDMKKVGNTWVYQNPTSSDHRDITAQVREEFPHLPRGEATTRTTRDKAGNSWVWPAHKGTHEQMESQIAQAFGVSELNQNNSIPTHSEVIREAIQKKLSVPARVQAEYPHWAEYFPKSTTNYAREFQAAVEKYHNRWVTIGAKSHHGGTAVELDANGNIVKGPKTLAGQHVGSLRPKFPTPGDPSGEFKLEGGSATPPAPKPKQGPLFDKQPTREEPEAKGTKEKKLPYGPSQLHPSDIKADPSRFQYKISGIDQATGVTKELKEVRKFNPMLAGQIMVWQDPDNGETYVVNGHHRHELATRTGYDKPLSVYHVEAKNAQEARAAGALANIAGGKGTAIDAAKFMRDSGRTVQDLADEGISLSGKIARDGAVLSKVSPKIFQDLANGLTTEDRALAIGKHVSKPEHQDQLYKILKAKEEKTDKNVPNNVVEEMAREMEMAGSRKSSGTDLFGDFEDEKSNFLERGELKAGIRKLLGEEKTAFKAVAKDKRASRLQAEGKNVLDTEGNKRKAQTAAEALGTFDKLVNTKGPLSDAINEAAIEYGNNPRSKKRILDELHGKIGGLLEQEWGGSKNDLQQGTTETTSSSDSGTLGSGSVEKFSRRMRDQMLAYISQANREKYFRSMVHDVIRFAKVEFYSNPADKIPGGLADDKEPDDFDAKKLADGVKVEREHTSDPAIAREIAMDHLTEDPDYYAKLEKIEKYKREMTHTVLRFANIQWDESKHPRAADGKFGQGGGSAGSTGGPTPPPASPKAKDKLNIDQGRAELAKMGLTLGAPAPWQPGQKSTSYLVTDKDGKSSLWTGQEITNAIRANADKEQADASKQKTQARADEIQKAAEPVHAHPAIQEIEKHYPPANPEGTDTLERNRTKDGSFTPQRQELHKGIIDAIRRNVPKSQKKTYFMLGGGPASGKSSILKSGQVTLPEAVHLDSDAIKGSLPEYAALVKEKDTRAAFYAHEESSTIAKMAQKESFAAGQDVLLDGTGDSSLDAVRSKCAAARQAGYAVNAEYVTCSVDEAVRRNLERAKKTGRLPPEKMLRDVHKSVSAILPQAVEEGLFDNVRLWDTEHPDASGNPTLVMSAAGNKLTVHHPELWDKFQAKAKG